MDVQAGSRHANIEASRIQILHATQYELTLLEKDIARDKIDENEGYRQIIIKTNPLRELRPLSVRHLVEWAQEKKDKKLLATITEAQEITQNWLTLFPAVAKQQERPIQRSKDHLLGAITYFTQNIPAVIAAEKTLAELDEEMLQQVTGKAA